MTTRTQQTTPGRWVPFVFLAALVAVLATLLSSASASAATTATAETRVRASASVVEVPVGPPQSVSAGEQLRNKPAQVIQTVATGVAAKTAAAACSFSGSTTVLMADGTKKPIDQVKVGDKVIATDPETGQQVAKTVKNVWVHYDTLTDLVFKDGTVLTTTEDHPYWSVDDRRWERADELGPGERMLSASGAMVRAAGIRWVTGHNGLAYNLNVEDLHTFHVGADEILVHNSATCPTGVLAKWANKADFSSQKTMAAKYDAHAADFGITGNRNMANMQAYQQALQNHMTAPGTRIYRFNYRGQGQAVGFINPSSNAMVMLRSDGTFWSGFKLGGNQFSSIVDKGFLW